jgi:excisionase family DNA binding protein
MTTLEGLRQSNAAVITVTEAAEVLRVDYRTVSRACQDGTIPSIKLRTRVLIPRELFVRMLTGQSDGLA